MGLQMRIVQCGTPFCCYYYHNKQKNKKKITEPGNWSILHPELQINRNKVQDIERGSTFII